MDTKKKILIALLVPGGIPLMLGYELFKYVRKDVGVDRDKVRERSETSTVEEKPEVDSQNDGDIYENV